MKKQVILILFCLQVFVSFGQGVEQDSIGTEVVDSLYREDQFYFGVTFNLLFNRPEDINQSGFSGGMHMGFLRDMPINKERNVAVAMGLGYSLNVYNQNLLIGEEEVSTGVTTFASLSGVEYDSNRFTTHLIELPLEFRWRTSIPETHKFYRVYAGFKAGYLFSFRSNYKEPGNQIKQTDISSIDRFRMGLTFAFGWNTFNFYFYYGLNPFFGDEATIENETVGLNAAKIGLMFYIL
ncbi:porin family protein [Aquimarina pacifica]|uniref:porin family protein n=1 Tax=Aquimarina pacifica TaxID=1296415 RepID=UPI00047222D3|nr:porin family protein [Aquimarina pacifica]